MMLPKKALFIFQNSLFELKLIFRLKTFSFSKTKLTSVTEKLYQHDKRVFKPPLQFNAKFFHLQIDQLTRHTQFIIHYESTHPCMRGGAS